MTEPVFVDTNVLVYCWDAGEQRKQPRAQAWETALWESQRGRLSTQVLHEFFVTVTRKMSPGLAIEDARTQVRDYWLWEPVQATPGVVARAWSVMDRFGFSYWEALICSAAITSGARHLLTEDLQDGQDIFGVTVVNPFAHPPTVVGLHG